MLRSSLTFLFLYLSIQVYSIEKADTNIILQHLTAITKTDGFRNHSNLYQLNQTAYYIKDVFDRYSDDVNFQEYMVRNQAYKNVICSFGPKNAPRIIVGAHYDVCSNQEGADDNASGVVGLLELARLLSKKELNYRIDLVAYSLEEPPYFRTDKMGSYIHAKYLNDNDINVYGMISLEMIGYFSEQKKSQSYPVGLFSLFYGKRGNYITLVKKWGSGKFSRKYCRRFKKHKSIRTKKFAGPSFIPGIDFSDHLNYWYFGYSALMITDTAFYRNKNYHEKTDTLETLDISKMAEVINTTFEALIAI